VRSDSVQRVYGQYRADQFRVNRRYQRKLVWAVEEKQRLVDSILKDLPIPLFLVAEIGQAGESGFELIDGLQRLNAIFAFIGNEYAVNGEYFDLDSLADTKLAKDRGELVQRSPVLSREKSAQIANYNIALSVYRAPDSASVDEVFRRINSGGRRLSRQGLRQAGTISSLADLVRILSSRIRGDTSPGDIVALRTMPKLSITNYSLDYGVPVDTIFWVQQGVLRREDVRESLDEQLVLDILIDCVIDPVPNSGTRIRDAYYNYAEDGADLGTTSQSVEVTQAIETYGAARLVDAFMRSYDEVRALLDSQQLKFNALIDAGSGGRSPRYFHGLFLAVYELMYKERRRIKDHGAAAAKMTGVGGTMGVPAGGGDWRREQKRRTVDVVKGLLASETEPFGEAEDLGRFGWASELETLLGNALVEQQMFDCKQGLLLLDLARAFDASSFDKIQKSLSAMANMGPDAKGYVLLGVADDARDAQRVESLDGVASLTYRTFQIVGIEREAFVRKESLNTYWVWLMQRLSSGDLEAGLATRLATDSRLVNYKGRAVAMLRVTGQSQPCFYQGDLYERSGSSTVLVPQGTDYMRVFSRFT